MKIGIMGLGRMGAALASMIMLMLAWLNDRSTRRALERPGGSPRSKMIAQFSNERLTCSRRVGYAPRQG